MAQFLELERNKQYTNLDLRTVISAYNSSSRRVIMLDFNGTIVIKEDVDTILKRDVFGSTFAEPGNRMRIDPRGLGHIVDDQ